MKIGFTFIVLTFPIFFLFTGSVGDSGELSGNFVLIHKPTLYRIIPSEEEAVRKRKLENSEYPSWLVNRQYTKLCYSSTEDSLFLPCQKVIMTYVVIVFLSFLVLLTLMVRKRTMRSKI